MQKIKALVVVASALMVSVGCGKNDSSSRTFLLPVLNANGETELQEVTLNTLSSLEEVSGSAARVLYNPEVSEYAVSGAVMKPRLSQSGSVNIPLDYETSTALSVYHSFEKLLEFDRRVLPDFSVSWPRQVGVDVRFEDMIVNNAFYAPFLDYTLIVPYMGNALPLSFNSGVIAHEHFHAHFEELIGSETVEAFDPHHTNPKFFKFGVCGLDNDFVKAFGMDRLVNEVVLRAWDEGLADFYAVVATKNSMFFDASINSFGERTVSEPALFISSRVQIEQAIQNDIRATYWQDCRVGGLRYVIGTEIARTFYQKFKGDREQGLQKIMQVLRAKSSEIKSTVRSGKLEPDWIVKQLVADDGSGLP